jgi:hypothetical protein
MNIVLGLLILAANPSAPIDLHHPDAVEIFHCGFEQASDREYDAWPDGWTRKRGRQYPAYLPARIVEAPAPDGQAALRIDLNGGRAAIFSPELEVKPLFSFVLEGSVRTEGLKHDRAWLSVTFYDEQHVELANFDSEQVADATSWRKLRLGPIAPPGDRVHYAVIGVHLEPTGGGIKADLKGAALFDDIWFARLPRMSLNANSSFNVYTDPSLIEITCRVSGVFEHDPILNFELADFSGRPPGQDRRGAKEGAVTALAQRGLIVAEKSAPASAMLGGNVTQAAGFAGAATWKPAVAEPGFYRVRATLQGRTGMILERELTLAILTPEKNRARGEFGWSLPDGDEPLSFASLGQLLPNVGINWVKFPVWTGEGESARLDKIVNFADRLSTNGIEMVGLLAAPATDLPGNVASESTPTAADIFTAEASTWYAALEPILTRLSLQVRWWQLGLDGDHSFVGYPRLAESIAGVKEQLQRYGQEIHLGFGWRTINEAPATKRPPWEFLALSATPPMTAAELATYLPAMAGQPAQRWVCLQPLSRAYSSQTRAGDLVHRMLAAKIAGAEAIFIPRPFDADSGLMNSDGTPGELLLVWRTTALSLAGAEYLGSMELPSGSRNQIFARNGEIVMVIWNEHPVEEVLYLGDDVRQRDIWGRQSQPGERDQQQVIEVNSLPTFITGLSEPLVRWNMGLRFQRNTLPSVCGVPHENGFTVKNFFPQGVGVQARLVGPEVWKIAPRVLDFKLAAGEEALQPFTVVLPLDAMSGSHPFRIDFDISADRHYQFSVYRRLEVGIDDITIEARSRLNDRGELEVVQQVTNHTDERVSFKCQLFAPNRRRMMSRVIELRQDRDLKVYRFPNGEELIGQPLWLRAEEIGGQRTLNFRFTAEK